MIQLTYFLYNLSTVEPMSSLPNLEKIWSPQTPPYIPNWVICRNPPLLNYWCWLGMEEAPISSLVFTIKSEITAPSNFKRYIHIHNACLCFINSHPPVFTVEHFNLLWENGNEKVKQTRNRLISFFSVSISGQAKDKPHKLWKMNNFWFW